MLEKIHLQFGLGLEQGLFVLLTTGWYFSPVVLAKCVLVSERGGVKYTGKIAHSVELD